MDTKESTDVTGTVPMSKKGDEQRGEDYVSSSSPGINLASLGMFTIYSPPMAHSSSFSSIGATLPDDSEYFKPTVADLKLAQNSLAVRSKELQETPLLTTKLREEKEEEKRRRFPTATIRIRFANRTTIEKNFSSSERIIAVYRFIRACLSDEARQHKFVLFSSPPRRDLKVSDTDVKDKSLFALNLAPKSNLFFRFLESSINLDTPQSPPPLQPSMFSRCISYPETANVSPAEGTPGTIPVRSEKKLQNWLKLNKAKS